MIIQHLGLMEFNEAQALQERLVGQVFRGEAEETLLLLEHSPVYTIGSGGDGANVLDSTIAVQRINRGGDVTYHGPGQLVGYPILDLSRRGRDLQRYLRFLEQVLIDTIMEFKVAAFPVTGKTGVWTGRGKVAAIGVGVRRWVTMHGFAINVVNDLSPFSRINPCGMANCPVTSLRAETGSALSMEQVRSSLAAHFQELLGRRLPLSPC
ncbi:lipoyl(octanoyl) transferase LipB [Geotalea sp. SG265]|uniref:lipoyl(octanoyl) transferase LipB n=1 Tax=Geotalea sp. SG265 TaxID=2922867 RepID=UPI001FB03776|nr:lipoyl(octanoyl) transferase LipB [Geotalea sp. SG265]